MSKRKMKSLILSGIFALFFCAMLMVYWGSTENVLDGMNVFWSNTTANEFLHDFYESESENTDDLHRRITFGHNPVYSTNEKPAFSFAMIDKDKNLVFRSESGIWWMTLYDGGGGINYVSVEEYMTPELKKEILKYQKKANGRSTMFRELEVHFDGKKYIPVSFTLDDQRDDIRKFVFTTLPVTHTFNDKNTALYYYLHDLDENSVDHIYYEKTAAKIEENIRKYEFNDSPGGGGFFGPGEMSWCNEYENYAFFYEVEYNTFFEVITSDMFTAFTFYLFVMFAIVTSVILCAASKLYDKNQNLNESKRAFTSAAAHELKTPLAVIQNQCECIIDNIAPEKNEQYVRSIYDEAVRMNSIVHSLLIFNRLSDTSEICKENCNISEIVKTELKKYETFSLQMNVNISSEIEENVFAECNAELIAIAIDNYLSNAVKYAENEKNVKIILRKEHKGFIFKVYNDCDNVNLNDDCWQILTKGDKSRNRSGNSTGMGLPVCRKIFRLHGYEHWFEKENNGVNFIFKAVR